MTEWATSGSTQINGNMKDKPWTGITIGERSQESKGATSRKAGEFNKNRYHLLRLATPLSVNDLEQGVKYLMRRENEEVASPQTEWPGQMQGCSTCGAQRKTERTAEVMERGLPLSAFVALEQRAWFKKRVCFITCPTHEKIEQSI